MKRDFLQSIQVEGMPLPKEVIDAIMAENGRDIQKAKAGLAELEQVRQALDLANRELEQFRQVDIEGLRSAASAWEEKYNLAAAQHQQELEQLRFDHQLQTVISGAKGRNAKAITALLDVENLKNSEDPRKAISDAVEQLKKDSAYLFEMEQIPPLYARGTGVYMGPDNEGPTTLAGALKEKFERK